MRLIRLTTDNPLGIFQNVFNSTITIQPKSKICLTSLTSEEAVEGLTINDTNDTIRVQLATTGGSAGIKTIRLTHGVYKDTDFDLFFKDFTDKLNATIVCAGAGVGYEYKVTLDNSGRVTILGKRSPYNDNAISSSSWIKNGVEGIVTGNKTTWSSISALSTSLNNVNMGLEQLFCNGGGVFSCRINTLLDDDPEQNGFIIGLTEIDPTTNPNYAEGIIKHGISVSSVSGNYSYYHNGTITATNTPIAYQSANSNDNDTLTIQLTENKYEYRIFNKSSVEAETLGIVLFSIDRTGDDKNLLYPFISFRGGKNNCKVDGVKYTPSPFTTPPSYSNLSSESPPLLGGVPSGSTRATVQFIDFISIALANYLGFENQRNPSSVPIPAVLELNLIASQQFIPTSFTDSFLVELLNISVDSYDGAVSGRRNLLAVVPQSYNEKQQIVYQATNLLWIDFLNAFPVDLRELRVRLIRDDGTPLRIKGISTMVVMIKDPNE